MYFSVSSIFSIFMHKFSYFPCFSEISFLNDLILENLRSSDTPTYTWSTYINFDCYVQYVYYWGWVNWNMNWIYYCPLLLSVALIFFSAVCDHPQRLHFEWEKVSLSVALTEWSKLNESIWNADKDSDFCSTKFSYLLNYSWWLSIWAEYNPPYRKISKKVCMNRSSE